MRYRSVVISMLAVLIESLFHLRGEGLEIFLDLDEQKSFPLGTDGSQAIRMTDCGRRAGVCDLMKD